MHLIIGPLSVELALVRPGVDAHSMDIVVLVFSKEVRAVNKLKVALSLLASFEELALVVGFVRPYFCASSVLLVHHPISLIFSTIHMVVFTLSMSHIIIPEAVEHASVVVDEAALSIGFIVVPVALVLGAISPDLDAPSLALTLLIPLAFINGSIVELVRSSRY